MEIENNHIASVTSHSAGTTAARPQESQAPANEAAAQPASSDSVSLTPAAQLLRNAESSIAEQPVVDSQRVSAVREAINDGSFEVNPAQIASKMMSLEQALTDLR
jgi:negative regulator of flagellin synthesis FlgM